MDMICPQRRQHSEDGRITRMEKKRLEVPSGSFPARVIQTISVFFIYFMIYVFFAPLPSL
jgi:hypothetical protein